MKESLQNVQKNNIGDLVTIEQKDIFTLDLSKASVIALYLLLSLNVKLIPQLMKLKQDKVIELYSNYDHVKHKIYLWTTPLAIMMKSVADFAGG